MRYSGRLARIFILAPWLALLTAPLYAQRDRDDDDDDRRGRFDAAAMLPRFDDNGDGIIQPGEVSDRGRRFYERIGEQAGFDPNQPVVVSRAVAAIKQQQQRAQRAEDREKLFSTLRNQSGDSLVPGFGLDPELPAVPGFGLPAGDLLPLEQLFTERLLGEVNEIFERYDDNKDGQLDQQEQSRVRWSSDPQPSDLNRDGILDRREMAERLAQRWGDTARIKPETGAVAAGSDSASGSSGGGSDASSRVRSYASSLLKQYDANKNGVLEKDEWGKMSGNPARADTNNDGVVTLDELTNRLANYSRGDGNNDDNEGDRRRGWGSRSSGGSSSFYRPRSDNSEDRGSAEGGGSYRFLSPAERLPKGTPDWFTRSDADGDGDGQVSMHEYAASWSDSKAAEFAQLDHNGDGRITPEEALEKP